MKAAKTVVRVSAVVLPSLVLIGLFMFGAANLGKIIHSRYAEAAEPGGDEALGDASRSPVPWELLAAMDVEKAVEEDGKLVQDLPEGAKAVYALRPRMQAKAEKILLGSDALAGALVLVEVRTGRILALAELRSSEYAEEALPVYLSARSPAASLFKIVTASALLDEGAADADTVVCYHRGAGTLHLSNLEDDPGKDTTCVSLALAMGKSLNTVFAKLADRNLDVEELRTAGERYGFGRQIPLLYGIPPQVSTMDVPSERLEFARTAAGFWHVYVTPLHAAFIAQAVANEGEMLRPMLVERVEEPGGKVLWEPAPKHLMQCLEKEEAQELAEMMVETVSRGTAKKHFVDPRGIAYIPDMEIAGKTGSLAQKSPYRFYSWFIGFAPADEPEVAVASLAVNGMKWKLKGATMARELLRRYYLKRIKKK